MLKTNLLLAFRHFLRGRLYAVINLLGLSVGLMVSLVIAIYLYQEMTYDRFHSDSNRIFRIAMHLEMGENTADLNSTHPVLANTLEEELPEVEKATHLYLYPQKPVRKDSLSLMVSDVLYANDRFLDVFSFPLLAGDKKSFEHPDRLFVIPEVASVFFPGEAHQNIPGKVLTVDEKNYTIAGIIEEAPFNSHFPFKIVANIGSIHMGKDTGWDNLNVSTYALTTPGVSAYQLEKSVYQVIDRHLGHERMAESGLKMEPIIQPLTQIHLSSNLSGELSSNSSWSYVYTLGAIAFFILLLACTNFVNLSTARSVHRSKEVGVRKVLGSGAGQLRFQFFTESVFMAFLAMLLAVLSMEILKPVITSYFEIELLTGLLYSPEGMLTALAFTLLVGLVSGSYPAFYLSSFIPQRILKQGGGTAGGKSRLRSSLVIFQFCISLVLISVTTLIIRQIKFMQSADTGFEKEQLMVIENMNNVKDPQVFLEVLNSQSFIISASSSIHKPIDDYDGTILISEDDRQANKLVNMMYVNEQYFETTGMELLRGRTFSRSFGGDSLAIVINETASKYLFKEGDLNKKVFYRGSGDGPGYKVVGVVRDFNFESLKKEINPVVFFLSDRARYAEIKLHSGDRFDQIAQIEALWNQVYPTIPFEFSFADQDYQQLFTSELRLSKALSTLTILAVFIACLGLVGLTAYTVEQRRKEIGIRKVLGAGVKEILWLLLGYFTKLLLISLVLAVPIAWLLSSSWLEGFAYRVPLNIMWFFLSGLALMVLAWLTMSFQTLRAAGINPVEVLKNE